MPATSRHWSHPTGCDGWLSRSEEQINCHNPMTSLSTPLHERFGAKVCGAPLRGFLLREVIKVGKDGNPTPVRPIGGKQLGEHFTGGISHKHQIKECGRLRRLTRFHLTARDDDWHKERLTKRDLDRMGTAPGCRAGFEGIAHEYSQVAGRALMSWGTGYETLHSCKDWPGEGTAGPSNALRRPGTAPCVQIRDAKGRTPTRQANTRWPSASLARQ
jgi:hypothetical protein